MTTGDDLQAHRGRVEGRVQGVAFRATMQAQARRCGAHGWVRNEPDGAVEFLVQGTARAVKPLLDWARRGPAGASVDAFNCREVEPSAGLRDFEIRA